MAKQKGKKKGKIKLGSLFLTFLRPQKPTRSGAVGDYYSGERKHTRAKQRPVYFCFVSL
jgi:hypothetical protein